MNYENYPPLPLQDIVAPYTDIPIGHSDDSVREAQKHVARHCWELASIRDPEFADELEERFGPFDEASEN